MTFKPVDTALNFPASEARILKFWKEHGIFEKSLWQREHVKDTQRWVFYEGPPTANGKPHPGHVLTRVVKDLFPRYKTMCGYYVPRKAGWDTHGLPVEIEVEKELKLDGKKDIEKYGVEPFVRKCIDSVFRYTAEWETLTDRIGFWINLKDAYVTYHQSYVESVWWSLKELHSQGLLYRGHKILPWCPHCQTGLSSHEVGQGYKEVEDPSVYVTFRSVDDPKVSFLAWTTTPWTLPSNAALAVKADTEYSHVKVTEEKHHMVGETLIFASALVKSVMGKLKYEVVKTELGSALVGKRYQPLHNWVEKGEHDMVFLGPEIEKADGGKERPVFLRPQYHQSEPWTVLPADFVTLDTGTGIVHIAPAYGADDYTIGKREGLPIVQLAGPDGRFLAGCGFIAGKFVKDADKDIIKDLKDRGLLLKREGYKHDYPFCWRCNNPLIYFARGGWFIRTTQEIGHVIENNKQVDWHPEHIKNGRFGSFLESNIDWALSRERYWGTPLNIWICEGCEREEAVGSFAELRLKPNVRGLHVFDAAKAADQTLNENLRVHKPWIDAIFYTCSKCGNTMERVKDVIDCWYDSGAMPFAQWGYPHAEGSKEKFKLAFPADFISEAIDQTRGWFYSLITESTLLFSPLPPLGGGAGGEGQSATSAGPSPLTPLPGGERGTVSRPYPHPFKTCLVLGHVCDEKGEKMSKSKGNYLDPTVILDEEGADALRWFFYSSTNPWTNVRFSRPAVREAQKEFLVKLRNVYSFFVIYANIDGFATWHKLERGELASALMPAKPRTSWRPTLIKVYHEHHPTLLDRWIVSELNRTIKAVRARLDEYDIFAAAQELNTFVESLSNWYVRRSRDRFWSAWQTPERDNAHDLEKRSAYATLYECLVTVAKLAAPFVPFMAEELWQNLVAGIFPDNESVAQSVHLTDYPVADESVIDENLASEIALVREVASLGRAARSGAKLKTRQPLAKVIVVVHGEEHDAIIRKHEQVLLDELNVKKIEIAHQAEQFVNYELKPNFKAIGSKHRELVPHIKAALAGADAAKMRAEMAATGKAWLALPATPHPQPLSPEGRGANGVELTPEEVEVSLKAKDGYAAASGKSVVVVLDTQLTPELLDEGIAREIVNRINGWRSDLKLAYEQRLRLALAGSAQLEDVARKFADFIGKETLAVEIKLGEKPDGWQTSEIEIDGEKATLSLASA